MSTKNLARTVIEGGRTRFSTHDRRTSRQRERARVRSLCRDAMTFEDPDDQTRSINSRGLKVSRHDHDDKLGAAYRWLRSQIGRPWDRVRSDLFKKFNPRTLQGNHLLRDHMLREVEGSWYRWLFGGDYGFYISDDGLLSLFPKNRWNSQKPKRKRENLNAWLKNRRVMDIHGQQYWMIPEKVELAACGHHYDCVVPSKDHKVVKVRKFIPMNQTFWRVHVVDGVVGMYDSYEQRLCPQPSNFKQGSVLSADDKKKWFSLDSHDRELCRHYAAKQVRTMKW